MPTYSFSCPEGHAWEMFLSILDLGDQKCPKCGAVGKREIGAGVGVLMKNRGPVSDSVKGAFEKGKLLADMKKKNENVDGRIRDLGHEVP